MNIEELQNIWSKDSKIEDTQLDIESLKIPTLHSKYLKMLTTFKQPLKPLET